MQGLVVAISIDWVIPFCRGRILNHCEKDEGQYDEAQPIFWATGACLVVRSSAYHSIGGLHAPFFRAYGRD